MAYIGKSPTTGKFQKLDDISSGFNDSTTTFAVQSNGTNVQIDSAQQLLVSIDGVLQEPTSAYTTSASGITFTEAPNTNATFFAILLGETGLTSGVPDGSVTAPKIVTDAVETAKIKDLNVTTGKIADLNVTTGKIASDAITNLKISPNIVLRGTTTFMGAAVERANIYAGNVKGGDKPIITIDNQDNGVVYFTTSSHENSEHTVNFINMDHVAVGNTTSFVVIFTNNVDTQSNITKVQIQGDTTNAFFFSGLTSGGAAGSVRYATTGQANLDVYSFSVIKTDTSAYTTIASVTNFT